MANDLQRRLAKLETGSSTDEIIIWTDHEGEAEAMIDRMIEAGEITEADRVRCVHWEKAKGTGDYSHEQALAFLD